MEIISQMCQATRLLSQKNFYRNGVKVTITRLYMCKLFSPSSDKYSPAAQQYSICDTAAHSTLHERAMRLYVLMNVNAREPRNRDLLICVLQSRKSASYIAKMNRLILISSVSRPLFCSQRRKKAVLFVNVTFNE